MCGFMRAIAAKNDQTVEFHFFVVGLHRLDFVAVFIIGNPHQFERLAGSAEDGAAQRKNTGKVFRLHEFVVALD